MNSLLVFNVHVTCIVTVDDIPTHNMVHVRIMSVHAIPYSI